MQIQQTVAPQIQVSSQLSRTLEAAIQAQLASDRVERQQLVQTGKSSRTPGLNSEVFQTRVQRLIDITNVQEIQK